MEKRYIVELTSEERAYLEAVVGKGKKAPAYQIKHAHILLNVDVSGPNGEDLEVARMFRCHRNTVANVRQRFVEQGLEVALERKRRATPPVEKLLDGQQEARLIALSCSQAPEGRARWTLRMLADELVILEVVDSISHETVRQTLKKNELKPHLRKCWVIPPEHNADFVAHMEEVLAVYERPYDVRYPVICMDEQPTQLIEETRKKIAGEPGQPERCDVEYKRNGTAVNFLFTEPLADWRKVSVRTQRTQVDWAQEIRTLLEDDYPDADTVNLVCDNLNTHTIASLYEAFPPEIARRLVERLDIHFTPKHGSWLNIAEIELSILTQQCLDRRIPDLEELRKETDAWGRRRNAEEKTVDWQFTTTDARIKLKRLYPQFKS